MALGWLGSVVAVDAAAVCVAGVAFGSIDLHSVWQAGVALGDIDPSPFSFLPVPSRLHLSFATYWKKLACGVIQSFNCVCVLIFVHVDLSALFLFCVTEMDGGGVGK